MGSMSTHSNTIKQMPMTLDLLGGMPQSPSTAQTPISGQIQAPPPTPKNALDDLDLIGSSLLSPSLKQFNRLEFTAFEDSSIVLKIVAVKTGATTMKIDMVAKNQSNTPISNLKLAVSAAKYVTVDLTQPTGTSLLPNGQNDLRQVLLHLNSVYQCQ